MRTYECPSCGAAVNFSSGAAVFAVCEHCRSMVVRTDVKLEAIGVMAELPPDLSPMQLGTTGTAFGQPFTLLGRVRLAWEQGSWTEWYAAFADGRRGWVAETQGFFAVSFLNEQDAAPARPDPLEPGQTVDFARRRWLVIDRKEVVCLGGEGELPFVAKPGSTRTGVDLVGPKGEFGTLEFYSDGVQFYEGLYAEFANLRFENLRDVPGWSPGAQPNAKRRESRTLSCLSCAAPVQLRAEGLSMTCVCGSCGTILDASRPDVQVVQASEKAVRDLKPILPLGRRATLNGISYETIGFVVRADAYASWSEYLLFNPWHGFAWLVTYQGHWSFIRRLLTPPPHAESVVWKDGVKHTLFARGETQVRGVLGEFYWRVTRGEVSEIEDFVAPPSVVSKESYPGLQEVTWSAGEYKSPSEIATAFALEGGLPAPFGSYLNQPNPHRVKWQRIWPITVLAILLLLLLQGTFAVFSHPVNVHRSSFTFARAANQVEAFSTPPFSLTRGAQPVAVRVEAPVNNNWMEFDLALVDAATGETRVGGAGVSFYHGSDSDGPWSEGSTHATEHFAAVPAGEYFLRVAPEADPAISRMTFTVSVDSGGVFWSNFFAALVLVLLYPVWVLWRRAAFERARWAESDYSPYASGTTDDD